MGAAVPDPGPAGRDACSRIPVLRAPDEPIAWDEVESYLGSASLQNSRTYEWNHGLAEIMSALTSQGLVIELFEEHRFLEWQGQHHMIPEPDAAAGGCPSTRQDRIPLMYSLMARRRSADILGRRLCTATSSSQTFRVTPGS